MRKKKRIQEKDKKETKRGIKRFLQILNSKPVIGALIFIALSLATVWAGNIVVQEGSMKFDSGTLNLTSTSTIYYAPNSSEPGLGTPHNHYKILINAASPAGAGYYDVDASGDVPVGTKLIYIMERCVQNGGYYISAYTDSTPTPSFSPITAMSGSASQTIFASGLVTLDSNRHFVYYVNAAPGAASVYIIMYQYWV